MAMDDSIDSQSQVKSHGVLEGAQQIGRKATRDGSDALNGYRPDLLSLRLGYMGQAARFGGEKHLKRVDPAGLACNRDDGDNPSRQVLRRAVGAVIAHDNGGTTLVSLTSPSGVAVNPDHIPPPHQPAAPVRPSAAVASHSSPSEDAHSSQAAA